MHGGKLAYNSMHFLLDVFGVQPSTESRAAFLNRFIVLIKWIKLG